MLPADGLGKTQRELRKHLYDRLPELQASIGEVRGLQLLAAAIACLRNIDPHRLGALVVKAGVTSTIQALLRFAWRAVVYSNDEEDSEPSWGGASSSPTFLAIVNLHGQSNVPNRSPLW